MFPEHSIFASYENVRRQDDCKILARIDQRFAEVCKSFQKLPEWYKATNKEFLNHLKTFL